MASAFKMCLDEIKRNLYHDRPSFSGNVAYENLTKRERMLIDNILSATFKAGKFAGVRKETIYA